jgi:cyclohexa-1,5-dienecarbonyl-CoA hydratase
MGRIREELAALAADPGLRVLVLRAEGKHFSAGASVEEHLPPEHERMIPEFMDTVRALHHFPLPVVAAVRGRCLGGGFELATCADLLIAGEGAVLGVPEIVLGVLPPAACAFLPRMVAPGPAAALLFTGDPLDAGAALDVGLVREVVPDDQVEARARAVAGRIARHSGASLRATKKALRAAAPGLDEALDRAARIYQEELMQTADAVEGLKAFVEKRSPEWSDR